jgi:hypothetical protein
MRSRVASVVLLLPFVVAACGGGAVSVRSNFSGASLPQPNTPSSASQPAPAPKLSAGAGQTQPGLVASGGRALGIAVVLGLMVADGIHWANAKLKQALRSSPAISDSVPGD